MSVEKEYLHATTVILIAILGVMIGLLSYRFSKWATEPGNLATACNQVEKGAVWDGDKCVVTVTRKAGE